jgi:hypothetical protein
MQYAAMLRRPGQPPFALSPFAARDDEDARIIANDVAARIGEGAAIWMIWEKRGEMTRQF